MIDSKADADKNKLSTDMISYSDIKNEAEWSAETKGVNYQKGDGVANKDKGLNPNFAGSKGEDDSTTKSAIAPGEIEIRSDEGKEEKDKTDLADLSRDPDKANNPLDKIFDKDKILEKQQAAALFGEIGFTLVGDLAAKLGWEPDDPRRAILHGLVGGLMAEINGGKFGDGLTVGAINELIVGQILNEVIRHKIKTGQDLLADGELQWISTLLGGILNENQGAAIAGSGTKYNTDNHTLKFSVTEERLRLMIGNISDEDAQVLLQIYDGKMFSLGSANTVKEMLESSYWQIQNAKSNAIVTEDQLQAATLRMSPTELAMSAASPFAVMGGVIILVEGTPIFIAAGSSAYQALQRLATQVGVLANPSMSKAIEDAKNSGYTYANRGNGVLTGGGRVPANLTEEFAIREVASNPAIGDPIIKQLGDPRWQDGWVKMQQEVNGVVIHYLYNPILRAIDDLKIVN